MHEVLIYSRRGCHLCEEMLAEVEPLCRGKAALQVRDVDADPEWQARYGLDIPVLLVDGAEICRHRLSRDVLLAALNY